jgi:hypothetical protein
MNTSMVKGIVIGGAVALAVGAAGVTGGRGGGIRTRDPLHPMQVRYQAAPRPDEPEIIRTRKPPSNSCWNLGKLRRAFDRNSMMKRVLRAVPKAGDYETHCHA